MIETNENQIVAVASDAAGEERESSRARRPLEHVVGVLRFISSVRFGLVTLSLLFVCCMIGMLIMQQNMNGFQEYYRELQPAEQDVYGALGFFDIYRTWYFTLLLVLTGLSIVLTSIFHFPHSWRYLVNPKKDASREFISTRKFHGESRSDEAPGDHLESIVKRWKTLGFKPVITRKDDKTVLFAQKNPWNRFGAQATHVALILIFIGGFITSRYSSGGVVEVAPGRTSNEFVSFNATINGNQVEQLQLPFTIECTDLRQELIDPKGGLEPMNTIDWLTYIKITDGGETKAGLVHLNEPFDYRGYRFFQSSFEPQGYARRITVSFQSADGGPPLETTIGRNETVALEGIGRLSYDQFYPDFNVRQANQDNLSGGYSNPAVRLNIVGSDGSRRPALAFNPTLADQVYGSVGTGDMEHMLVDGKRVILKDFEKVAISHTLTVQYDPGREPVYAGFVFLLVSLFGVFFFSHQRVWALVEPTENGSKATFGGDTNRYGSGFGDKFASLAGESTDDEGDDK